MKHTRDHNGGNSIGLIRTADTRMGGHVISMLRTLRLKDALLSTISSASFLQGKFKIEKKIVDVLKRETTWEFMEKFVRAVFPVLIVLRLADKKEPVMDKLYFYVRRMDKTLEKSQDILDELQLQMKGVSWRILSELDDDDPPGDDDSDNGSEAIDYSSDSNTEDSNAPAPETTLGQKVIGFWKKRRDKLVCDFSIAGWLLSPMQEIRNDSDENMTGEHRDAIERLLKKMYGAELADDSDEMAKILNTFWAEFEQFQNKLGPYEKAYIWNPTNSDLQFGKSHMWHKKNSFFQTKILGKFACRVCSKIVGIGSAERNWGDVKHLKSMKRSHLSPEAVEKQATIYGASCMADAALAREKAQENTSDPYKFWDDEDFDSQFDMFAVQKQPSAKKRYIKCYLESWEKDHVRKHDDVSKAKFLKKYGGLEFDDIDHLDQHYKIDNHDMDYRRGSGWCVKAYTDGDKPEDWTPWVINYEEALHTCLATYYTKHPELNVVPIILQDQKEVVADLASLVQEDAKKPASKKQKNGSPKKSAKSNALKTSTRSVPQTQDDNLDHCGGCGQKVGSVHKCDKCNRNMHPFCGRTIGEEGYGSAVRCPGCDKSQS
mmetsp:Transcript_118603/g.232913  ORF Transcript_118603/g.232913 Transcript_118603/m.232913 type:complete len:602 (-) Transcript_118603:31-1836(-)